HAVSAWGARGLWYKAWPSNEERLYRLWVREHEPSRKALRAQREWSNTRTRTFTLITFLGDPVELRLQRTADSVFGQTYPRWEWIIVGSEQRLRDAAASRLRTDERVRRVSVEGSRADAWNAALTQAEGEYVALLGAHDQLEPVALYEVARALEQLQDCDVLYSD